MHSPQPHVPTTCLGTARSPPVPTTSPGKFSLRLVPDMHPERVEAEVRAHVDAEWAKLGSPNQVLGGLK